MNPTNQTYQKLQNAYDFFNKELFKNKLPACLITMQRKGRARGFFCAERFEIRDGDQHYTHEIALNPAYFKDRTDEDIISTLVHEMAHLWQQENGSPSRGNYHNREWAEKMEALGLIPSNTGEEGGARTGESMSHYINPQGKFAELIKLFLKNNTPLQYQDRPSLTASKPAKKNKVKYTCPRCLMNVWGKPDLNIVCGEDKSKLVENKKT